MSDTDGAGEGTRGGLLRAVEAEARRRERIRIADVLQHHLTVAGHADVRTTDGRRRYGLEQALAVIPLPDYADDGPWTELAGSVGCDIDGIDVGLFLELVADGPGEEPTTDPFPIRLKVVDGAEDTVAHAYMTPENAAELEELLAFARKRHEEWLATRPVDNPQDAPAGD